MAFKIKEKQSEKIDKKRFLQSNSRGSKRMITSQIVLLKKKYDEIPKVYGNVLILKQRNGRVGRRKRIERMSERRQFKKKKTSQNDQSPIRK